MSLPVSLEEERLYAAALSSLPHVGSKTIRGLYEIYHSFHAIWQAPVDELQSHLAGTRAIWASFRAHRNEYDWEKLTQYLQRFAVSLVTYTEDAYPPLLRQTYNPPAVLWYQGNLTDIDQAVAIVGSRKATPYGLSGAQQISEELSRHDVVIISGGARGIDTRAHQGALDGEGRTIAVVAHGLDTIYPRENKKLFASMLDTGGAIVTEYAFGMAPLAQNFPARNRIIAGLSRGVIVVEAALKSGSLITADFALEEGRDVFTVPGSIFSPLSRGTNSLLRKGAIPLTQSEDVLTEYGWNGTHRPAATPSFSLTLSESAVLDTLTCDTSHTQNELVYLTQLPPPQLGPILLQLQLYGLIEEVPGGSYVKKRNL